MSERERVILHCDLNAFYASAESLDKPQLRTVPMAVCGDPESRHGIILAKNELAKARGVKTAETISSALRKCPELKLVGAHHDRYSRLSREVNAIYARFTDQVEPFGIDESWLDVTGSRYLFGDGETIANTLRETIKRETGLTISVGVSFCKVFAKLGSDMKKPDAVTLIPRDKFREIVWPLPVRDLLFVGRRAEEGLKFIGIETIGDLAKEKPERLREYLGKLGETLGRYARGEDDDPVRRIDEREDPKSVGNGLTFAHDLLGERELTEGITMLSDEVASRLRASGMFARTVQLQIKDPQFRVISRQKQLERPTSIRREIADAAIEILRASWDMTAPVRALTVTAQNLSPEGATVEQPSLFDDPAAEARREREKKLEGAIDDLRRRYGNKAVVYGSSARAAAKQSSGGKKTQNDKQNESK